MAVFSPESPTIDSQKGKPVPFHNILTKMDIWVLPNSLAGTVLGARPSSVTGDSLVVDEAFFMI